MRAPWTRLAVCDERIGICWCDNRAEESAFGQLESQALQWQSTITTMEFGGNEADQVLVVFIIPGSMLLCRLQLARLSAMRQSSARKEVRR